MRYMGITDRRQAYVTGYQRAEVQEYHRKGGRPVTQCTEGLRYRGITDRRKTYVTGYQGAEV